VSLVLVSRYFVLEYGELRYYGTAPVDTAPMATTPTEPGLTSDAGGEADPLGVINLDRGINACRVRAVPIGAKARADRYECVTETILPFSHRPMDYSPPRYSALLMPPFFLFVCGSRKANTALPVIGPLIGMLQREPQEGVIRKPHCIELYVPANPPVLARATQNVTQLARAGW
jgi:hypothetical protein